MEMLVFSLICAWVSMRYIGGDAIAAVRGTESPRIRDRRAREQLACDRATAGLGPSVGQAITGRIADRIAHPPEKRPRGPAREALAAWWQDVWAEADRRRRERLEVQRRRATTPPERRPSPPPPPPDVETDVIDVIDAEIVDDEPVDTGPTDEDYTGPTEPVSLDKDPPAPTDPPATEDPVATVHPIRGDLTMTTTSDLSGETLDPVAASAFVAGCSRVASDLVASIDQSLASLRERGVAGKPIEHLVQMQESFTIAAGHASDADVFFQDHIGKQQDLAADETLAGTVEDTYLGAGNA